MSVLAGLDLIILFFALGFFASWIKSDLRFPENTSKFLSVYLLLALGLKGGHQVKVATHLDGFSEVLLIGMLSCFVIPFVIIRLLKKDLGSENAAALAASYGSVSAVTFIAAHSALASQGIEASGYMVAVMALMEVPAIVIALYLYKKSIQNNLQKTSLIRDTLDILKGKSIILLLGGFTIGYLFREQEWNSVSALFQDAFKGFLALFLLDLGVNAQAQISDAWKQKGKAVFVALILPLLHGSVFLLLARVFNISLGNQVLIGVLAGSASYIAAPAAIRFAIPKANAAFYIALPLGLTFPMNVIFGIPYYIALAQILEQI